MKVAIFAIFVLIALATPSKALLKDTKEWEQVLEGVLEGIAGETKLTDVVSCVKDIVHEGELIEEAIKDFLKKDAKDVAEGLKKIGEALESIPTAMTECKAGETEIKNLVDMIKNFKSPMSFAYHVGKDLLVNGVSIYHDIKGAINAYQAKEYEVFGYDIGHALSSIFIGTTQTQLELTATSNSLIKDIKVWETVIEGILEGIAGETKLTDVVSCIKDIVHEGELIEEAVQDFLKKDAKDVAEGLKKIGEALESIPTAMTECKAAVGEIKNLVDMIKNFKSPMSFAYHVGKDLLVNGVSIYHDIKGAIAAYKAKEYKTFGYDIGHALASIFIGAPIDIKEHFGIESMEEFKAKYLGLIITDLTKDFPPANNEHLLGYTNVPSSFDSRTQWSSCIGAVRNQLHCGSCWAFSAAEVLSDRFCIASNGQTHVTLSPQYMVSCDKNEHACQGGMLNYVWQFFEQTGTVTDACMPYVSGDGKTVPSCPSSCEDSSRIKNYRAQGGSTKVFTTPTQIKLEIMAHGPVQTGFMVYSDFMSYRGGVYKHRSGQLMGGHAVKIVGWGVDETEGNYWIVANSWGPSWGESGFFKIKEGNCGIDSQVITGQADVSTSYKFLSM